MPAADALYTFDQARFAKMLDKAVRDKEFGTKLQKKPLATLRESGFDVRADVAKHIGDKTLAEIQAFDPLGPVANVAVSVGVDVAVSVVISVAVHTKALEQGRELVVNPVLRDLVTSEVAERINVNQSVDQLANLSVRR
jgi:hypothetical protein